MIDPNEIHADSLADGFDSEDHRRQAKRQLRAEAEQDAGEREYEKQLEAEQGERP